MEKLHFKIIGSYHLIYISIVYNIVKRRELKYVSSQKTFYYLLKVNLKDKPVYFCYTKQFKVRGLKIKYE